MTSAPSPEGRRILVAEVTGAAGEAIQAWRLQHDPEQARRLPPHATLCYWAPDADLATLEQQIRHAFPEAVPVRLGPVREFDNDQHTFYVQVADSAALDEARERLYDGRHVTLPPLDQWTWHVTCVRDSRDRDLEAVRAAARDLCLPDEWRVAKVSYLQLRDGVYEYLAACEL
jgi:hypothetical protein